MTAVIPAWHLLAACQYTDPEIFFPVRDEDMPATADLADEARGVCIGCPVRPDCHRYALGSGERWGVWAGLTEQERLRELRRPVRRPAAEVFAEHDARYHLRQARRIALWEHEAVVAAVRRRAEELEELAA